MGQSYKNKVKYSASGLFFLWLLLTLHPTNQLEYPSMKLGFLLFTAVPLLGLAYVLWHVWQILPFGATLKTLLLLLMVAAFGCLFLSIGRHLDAMPMPLAVGVYAVGTSSLIALLYLFLTFLLLDIGRLCHCVPAAWLHHSATGSLLVVAIVTAVLIGGNIHYRHKVRQTLAISTEKPLKRPLKIVMMSDLHLGYHNRLATFRRWIRLVNAENPDLILIAGDIIDQSVRPLEADNMAQAFHQLRAPVVACLGNHEYYTGVPQAQRFFQQAGITLLRDSTLEWGDLSITGRDDRSNVHRRNLQALTREVNAQKFTILLDHQPYNLAQAERCGYDLQLSGHTHDGQVWPGSWIARALYEKSYGRYQRGNTHYYISAGMGIWGGKFRIGTCSEYLVLTIVPATKP